MNESLYARYYQEEYNNADFAPVTMSTISYYCLIRYVPCTIAEEFCNVAILAFNQEKIVTRWVQSFDRVHDFGCQDVAFLVDLQSRMLIANASGAFVPGEVYAEGENRHDRMTRIRERYINAVQFSNLRPSLYDPEAVLDNLHGVLLKS